MKKIMLVSYCLCFSIALFGQSGKTDIPQLDRLKKLFKADSISTPTYIKLPNNIKALTIVFRETLWFGKDLGAEVQQASVNHPEDIRKIENHVQLWLIPLTDYPNIDGSIRAMIPLCKEPNKMKREMAFAGKGYGFAWFVYAPTSQWIYIPKLLGLQDGDNAVDAAIREFNYESIDFLRTSLPEALSQIEKAIDKKHPASYDLICSTMSLSQDKEVIQWLIDHSSSKDQIVSRASRDCLVRRHQKEFISLYKRWLAEDAGKKGVIDLLQICKELQMPGLIDVLPSVLNSPSSVDEYRLAFEMERELRGEEISKFLLEDEKTICNFGYKDRVDKEKVDTAIDRILMSDDRDVAAVIGLSLAIYFAAKANWDDFDVIHKAGIRVLRNLPNEKGRALVKKLAQSCKNYDKDRLKELSGILKK